MNYSFCHWQSRHHVYCSAIVLYPSSAGYLSRFLWVWQKLIIFGLQLQDSGITDSGKTIPFPLKYPDIWPVCCFILTCWTYMVGLVNSVMEFIKMPDPCQVNSYKHWQKSELAKLKYLQSPWIVARSFLLPSYTSFLPPSIHIGPYTRPNS